MADIGIVVELPGGPRIFTNLVLDFTGTLARDGILLDGVAERLTALAERLTVTVMTADTCGTAAEQLAGLPIELRFIRDGSEKASAVTAMDGPTVVAIGNGRNDVAMLEPAGLAVAVIGPEGAAGALVRVADVVVRDIRDGLDLLLRPLRCKATLRD